MRKIFGFAFCALLGSTQLVHAATITPVLNSALCLDVAGGSSNNGTVVQIARCNNGNAQNWSTVGNTIRALGKCLDVRNGGTSNNTALQIWDCGNGNIPEQQFTMVNGTLVAQNSQKCVDISRGHATDGQPMQIYSCMANDQAQQWQTSLRMSSTPPTPTTPATSGVSSTATPSAGGRLMQFVNKCSQTVWVALQNNSNKPVPSPSGFSLAANANNSVALPFQWGGRMWGRTGCTVNGGNATCETGDCGGNLACGGIGGQPASLAEFLFDGWNGPNATQDFYDISLVDADNLPLAITPVGGSGVCYAPKCAASIASFCPPDLQVHNSSGQLINCLSSCTKYQTDDTCCRNANNTKATCPAPEGATAFKQACPDAYSYAYDDGTSTWNCTAPSGYVVTFCP